MNTQLTVAEQLSECLSEQMALLNVDSPCPKQQNTKRDLFKTIGLPVDDGAFSSPGDSSREKHLVRSSSTSVKYQAKRNQTSGYKNPEPETARRRRESLGRVRTSLYGLSSFYFHILFVAAVMHIILFCTRIYVQ